MNEQDLLDTCLKQAENLKLMRGETRKLTPEDFPQGLVSSRKGGASREGVLEMERQTKLFEAHRIGDLKVLEYRPQAATGSRPLSGVCLCGTPVQTTPRTVSTQLFAPAAGSAYYTPLDKLVHLQEGDASGQLICTHITQTLQEAFPVHLLAWKRMRTRAVAFYTRRLSQRLVVKSNWFRKDIGLLSFIEDIGLPEPGREHLLRTGDKARFMPDSYSWAREAESDGPLPFYAEHSTLYNRFHAARAEAGRKFRYFHWKHFLDFLEDIHPPEDLETNPGKFFLRWKDKAAKGYTPHNFEWVGREQARKQQQEHLRAPWNKEQERVSLAEVLPESLANETAAAKLLVVAELSAMLAGEDPLPFAMLEDLLDQARASAGIETEGERTK